MNLFKFAAKILFAANFCHSLFAAEIKILYRTSLTPKFLNSISQKYYGISEYKKLSIYDRKRLEYLIDPLGIGHVALELPRSETRQNQIIGWVPATDFSGDQIIFDDLARVETLLKQLQISNFDGIKFIYPSVPGRFADNTEWAKGGLLDPVYEIPITVSDNQFKKLREGITLFNSPGFARYQLIANIEFEKNLDKKEFPKFHFNCLMAVKELLAYAEIKTNLSFGEGFLCKFVENVAPLSRKRPNRPPCPTAITSPPLTTQICHSQPCP